MIWWGLLLLYFLATYLWLARYYYRSMPKPRSNMDGAFAALCGLCGPIWFPFYMVGAGLRRAFDQ